MSFDAEISRLKPKPKSYKHFVGGGLYVRVEPNGAKYWRIKYRFEKRERHFVIGVYPKVSPSLALEARDRVKKLLSEGIDPIAAKQEAAKLNPKPQSKHVIKLVLSENGQLSIETSTKLVTLIQLQTNALKSFLLTQNEGEAQQ